MAYIALVTTSYFINGTFQCVINSEEQNTNGLHALSKYFQVLTNQHIFTGVDELYSLDSLPLQSTNLQLVSKFLDQITAVCVLLLVESGLRVSNLLMALRSVWIIPFFTFAFSLLAFLISYSIAVYGNHVNALWPYISDSGAMSPESCIFSQLLNIASVFQAMTVYLRHRQIIEYYWHQLGQKGTWRIYSNIFLWIGFGSAMGCSIVANFQEINVIIAHYIGAFLAFTCGLFYLWAQTLFSYMMNPKLTFKWLCHFRLALCLLSTAAYINTIIFGSLAQADKGKLNPHCAGHLYIWRDDHPKYVQHTIATISEWFVAGCFQLYTLSFALELRHAYWHAPKLKLTIVKVSPEEISEIASSTSVKR